MSAHACCYRRIKFNSCRRRAAETYSTATANARHRHNLSLERRSSYDQKLGVLISKGIYWTKGRYRRGFNLHLAGKLVDPARFRRSASKQFFASVQLMPLRDTLCISTVSHPGKSCTMPVPSENFVEWDSQNRHNKNVAMFNGSEITTNHHDSAITEILPLSSTWISWLENMLCPLSVNRIYWERGLLAAKTVIGR